MTVKTFEGTHKFHRSHKSKEAKASWIAKKFKELIKKDLDVKVSIIRHLLEERYRVNVDEFRLYKAKQRALEVLRNEHG